MDIDGYKLVIGVKMEGTIGMLLDGSRGKSPGYLIQAAMNEHYAQLSIRESRISPMTAVESCPCNSVECSVE